MKIFNITTKETYQHNGEEKAKWNKVGELKEVEKDGKIMRFVNIPAIGLNAYVFEQTDRDTQPAQENAPQANSGASGGNEMGDINPF